jgi:hypothetical protein
VDSGNTLKKSENPRVDGYVLEKALRHGVGGLFKNQVP